MWHNVVTNFSKVSFVQIEGLLKRSINNYNKYEYEKNNLICRIDCSDKKTTLQSWLKSRE